MIFFLVHMLYVWECMFLCYLSKKKKCFYVVKYLHEYAYMTKRTDDQTLQHFVLCQGHDKITDALY